jgi:hypothetical protein
MRAKVADPLIAGRADRKGLGAVRAPQGKRGRRFPVDPTITSLGQADATLASARSSS